LALSPGPGKPEICQQNMPDKTLPEAIKSFGSSLSSGPAGMGNLSGSSTALFMALSSVPFVSCMHTDEAALRLHEDIGFYLSLTGRRAYNVLYIPSADSPENAGARAEALVAVHEGSGGVSVVASYESLVASAPEREMLRGLSATVSAGDEVERDAMELVLADLGYMKVNIVTAPGQYSQRGFILDVYPTTAEHPARIEFFGDEVESIRAFDIGTQRSIAELERVRFLAATLPVDGPPLTDSLRGIDMYFSTRIKEGIPEGAKLISDLPLEDVGEGMFRAPVEGFGGIGVLPSERKDIFALPGVIEELAARRTVMIVASSRGQAERLRDLTREQGLICPVIDASEAGRYAGNPFITVGKLSAGLNIEGLLVLTELEIFGGRPEYRPIRKSRVSGLMTSIDDLEAGDLVVHEDRGIGRFVGLSHQEVEGMGYDMILLEYAEGAKLHIPVSSIERIKKYHAAEGIAPSLESLGSKRWLNTRRKVKKRVLELARKLLKLYAEREVAEGHAFSPDTEVHKEFDSFFPYEETPDQVRAAEEIKRDMEGERPMDRLLCGDVGYGKTEVAMRAAFKAVFDGRQVAVLVPTTLLCEQHLRVFRSRFTAFPMRIEGLNRFKSRKETLETLEGLEKGTVDIVIATHALLRRDIKFAALGLLVVDEEHRFGVGQKEKIKELKHGVDVLAMSATPIPRTLQMSLSGIRTMSLIETPPEERQAVHSVVAVSSDGLIRDAIARELDRGGQVFVVHNRIKDIERLARKIRRLVPLATIAIAHGQMRESELEKIMLDFLNRETDVLLSTAIVGSGLDIPSANTIIVNMADRMGLADLYQLKGRVGRGGLKGYALFLIPGEGMITEEARGRLEALQDMSYMGAGFRLAMKDLEIRGAGNMLGPQQSGSIEAVGFDLYMDMLEEAVAEVRGEQRPMSVKASVNIHVNAFVPEGYIEDMALRLSVYRSISRAQDSDALRDIEEDVTDRFGKPPEEFMHLLMIRSIALEAERCMVTDIGIYGGSLRFVFSDSFDIRAEDIMASVPRKLRFVKGGFEVRLKGSAMETAIKVLRELKDVHSEAQS